MLELFTDYMDPILEDTPEQLAHKINKFKAINVKNNDKLAINLQKKISGLEKRKKTYLLF